MTHDGFSSADQIALAIVTACRLTGEDPEAVARGDRYLAARVYAMAGLLDAFPRARREGLGRCLGYATPRSAQARVIQSRQTSIWREDWAEEVLGALVAPLYGEQAA